MNILEITTFLRGGAGVFLARLSCELKNRGHNVDVVSSGKVDELVDWDELLNKLEEYKINHHKINLFKRDNEIFWYEVEKLAELIKKNNYDIIHVHAGVPALACHIAKHMVKKDVSVLATFHSWGKERPDWMNVSDSWAFNRCNKIVFDSEEYMNFGKAKGITAEAKVIYIGLMTNVNAKQVQRIEIRKKLTEKFDIPKDGVIITNLAELTERKGQTDLVQALKHVCEKREDVYLCLIGECRNTEYYEKLKNVINSLNLNNKVFLLGWVENPYEIVAASDFFVFPSYSEGFGLAIIEAISLGVPTIFSSIEGTKDIEKILGDSCLGTFEPSDTKRIASLILETLSKEKDISNEQVENSIEKVNNTFDSNKTVELYEDEMKQLIDKITV